MSSDWYLMNRPPYYNSGFEREEHFDYAYDAFNEALATTALSDEVVLYSDGLLDESTATIAKVIVQNNTSDVSDGDTIKQILSNIDTLEYGNYVKYKGKYYLITEVPGDNKIYEKAIMRQCNYLLKWVSNSGKIVEMWSVFIEATKDYASGESSNKSIALGNASIMIYLPKNTETIEINRGWRFIIDDYEHAQLYDPSVYQITKLNLIQKNDNKNSLFKYGLSEAKFNPDEDNKELMIANYYNRLVNLLPDDNMSERNNTCEITFQGNPELRIGGNAKTFKANFYDAYGSSVADTANWRLLDDNGNSPTYITVTAQTETSLRLKCENDLSLAGEIVYLTLTGNDVLAENTIELEIVTIN